MTRDKLVDCVYEAYQIEPTESKLPKLSNIRAVKS